MSLGKPFCANPLGLANKTAIATSAQCVRIESDQNAGSAKNYKTLQILTFGISEWSLGEPFCKNSIGFCKKNIKERC